MHGSGPRWKAIVDLFDVHCRRLGLNADEPPAGPRGHAPDGRLWVTGGEARELAVAAVRQAADRAPQHVTFGTGGSTIL